MITKLQYVEYLISTFGNYTGSHLAEHLDDVSHDVITDYLRRERLTSRSLWELVGPLISDGPDAFLILDDSVQDKRYSRFIELVKRQYSGAEHGLLHRHRHRQFGPQPGAPVISGRWTFESMPRMPMARPERALS